MKRIIAKTGKVLLGLLLIALVVVFARWGWAYVQVARTAVPAALPNGDALGSTQSLTILPLYEEAAVSPSYQSGHGVSYLVRSDAATILMDLGPDPAPLLDNMQQAGIAPDETDLLLISHNHPDHIGGLQWRPNAFTTHSGQSLLDLGAAYVPVAMDFPHAAAQVAEAPEIIAPGVATLGRMPFVQPFPFSLWQPLGYEQMLAVNVSGKGIVLITGCGHPTLERIVARAEALFAEPVVGVVGGLHYEALSAAEVAPHVQFLAVRAPQLVALSPHDNGPTAVAAFQAAFPTAYRHIQVGETIRFGATAVADTTGQQD